ncbi:small ribosomal subunit protein uS14m [Phymastichus coffea]|uniref:small ribosomal subunit protein uS14m n=1 Tax=Phymastichus coffea TaxID=108790 RepID=UPI00273ACBCF|nr:small ribosomal subunit protein uS14m [Phymastichus coffea]
MSSLISTSVLSKIIYTGPTIIPTCGFQQVRNKWTQWKTLRDMKRRKLAKDYAEERLRLVSMKRNDILPVEIRDLASKGFDNIPRQSALRQLRMRCVVTSRGHGTVIRWRVSRLIFRHLADYNKLAGIQRAIW